MISIDFDYLIIGVYKIMTKTSTRSFNCFHYLNNILISGQEKYMIERFTKEMISVQQLSRKKIIFRGLVNSFSQSVPLLAYAVALGYGGYMVASKEIEYKEIVR